MATKKTKTLEAETVEVTTETIAEENAVTAETAEEETEERTQTEKVKETSFSKSQILGSKKYSGKTDILNVILGNRKYTLSEVDSLLRDFLNSEVKE